MSNQIVLINPDDSDNPFVLIKKKELDKLRAQIEEKDTQIKKLIDLNTSHESELKSLRAENEHLNNRIKVLENEIAILKNENRKLMTERATQNAIMKLHECHTLVSEAFEDEYREWFNKPYDPVPNIGRFLRRSPKKEDAENYNFWQSFLTKYPGTDSLEYQSIYEQLDNMRAPIAHPKIRKLDSNEFDNLMKIVFPDYDIRNPLYSGYKNWLYMF